MIGVMIVPTGIEAKIGGHAGDANPAARLLASVCEKLIVHPNIVNAADFNGMTDNMLYVEGSMLDRFLDGQINLKEVKSNRIVVFANEKNAHTENCINTAKYVLGLDVHLSIFPDPLIMRGEVRDGKAVGEIKNIERCMQYMEAVCCHYDAVAIHTPVDVDHGLVKHYVEFGGVNPWGGIEAQLSKVASERFGMPVAHAPVEMNEGEFGGVGFPRLAAEYISTSHLFSVLKGLHKAPGIADKGICNGDVEVVISAWCDGKPHEICRNWDIPVIYVRENKTNGKPPTGGIFVENYLEAAGVVAAIRAGISTSSILL